MPRRHCLLIACLLLAVRSSLAQEAPLGARVQELLDFARTHNPDIASWRHDADAAAERIEPAGALPDPRFRTEWRDITRMGAQNPTLLPGNVGSTRYLLMQDLPWYGKRELRRETATAASDAARWRTTSAWQDTASRIKATHAQRYFLQASEALTREILALMQRLEQIAQVRYASGLSAQQDAIRAQLEQTRLREELLGIDNEQRQWQARMNALLGRSADADLAPAQEIWPVPAEGFIDFAELARQAEASNPQLLAQASQITAAEKERELTYANRYPDFTLGVSPMQTGSRIREWEFMVEINLPLQQGTRRAQERESEAMLRGAQARQEAVTHQILAELQENLAALEFAQRSLVLIKENLRPQSELTLRSALAGYETGKVDFATLLEAQTRLHLTRLNQLRQEMNARVRLADLERLTGERLWPRH